MEEKKDRSVLWSEKIRHFDEPHIPEYVNDSLSLVGNLLSEKIEKIMRFSSRFNEGPAWFEHKTMAWPINLSGREYNALNALSLLLLCERENYRYPVFGTFEYLQSLNYSKDKQSKRQRVQKDDIELPEIVIREGEKGFPVFLTHFSVIDKETKNKINYTDYQQLSEKLRKGYDVFPKLEVYNVFNISQTNIDQVRPDLYKKLVEQSTHPEKELMDSLDAEFSFPPVDKMINDGGWYCPIHCDNQEASYYSTMSSSIVVPQKTYFRNSESFYTNLFYEMARSTGAKSLLNRLCLETGPGLRNLPREDLVSELTAALVAQRYGMTKHVHPTKWTLCQSWLDSLKESPDTIKGILLDVGRACSMLTQLIDKMALFLSESNGSYLSTNSLLRQQKTYYASFVYINVGDLASELDEFRIKGDYKGLLSLAKEYYEGNSMNEEETYIKPCRHAGDDLLIEDNQFAVVYNGRVGGTYDIFFKYSEEQVRDHIIRYGIGNASEDVKSVAKQMVAEEFASYSKGRQPLLEMDDGKKYMLQYNKESDKLEAGEVSGMKVILKYAQPFSHDHSLESNISSFRQMIAEEEQDKYISRPTFHR